jgi:hypothetical protein
MALPDYDNATAEMMVMRDVMPMVARMFMTERRRLRRRRENNDDERKQKERKNKLHIDLCLCDLD